MSDHYKFFQNNKCEYFPCHKVKDPSKFNCLFCYCPLYCLGDKCGGNVNILENGIKDCSNCLIPHNPNGYEYITNKYNEVLEITKKNMKK